MLVFILPDYFSYFVSTNLPYELYRRHWPEKKMTSKCHNAFLHVIRHFSLLNVTAAGACGYDFPCDGERLVRAYLRRRRGTI